MYHVFSPDGNSKKISWIIQTGDSIAEQNRKHVEIYKDKVTNLQSKYIALHVGLFWAIGVFIIKNNDTVKIKLDEKIMYDQLTTNIEIKDELIKKRIQFIKQLINQRKLKVEFETNDSKKISNANELKTKTG